MRFKKILSWVFGSFLVAGSVWAATGWNVDGYGNIKGGRSSVILSHGDSTNCNLAISGSTLSVVGDDGNALSASNPCVIRVRTTTAGLGTVIRITTATSVTFGASSDTDGNLFGIDNNDWANELPFFLGATVQGGTGYLTISRLPQDGFSSSSSNICQKGDTDCDDQVDVMILGSSLTLSNFTLVPITQIGWFAATYSQTGSAWTFSLNRKTGFNNTFKTEQFAFPVAQGGCTSGKYVRDNSGTGPTYTGYQNVFYYISEDRWVDYYGYVSNTSGGTAGSGAQQLQVCAPFEMVAVANNLETFGDAVAFESGGTINYRSMAVMTDGNDFFVMRVADAGTSAVLNDQSSANRELQWTIRFRAQ